MSYTGIPPHDSVNFHAYPLGASIQPTLVPSIETLELPDLMRNPHVQSLFKQFQDATTQVIQAADTQKLLYNKNICLNTEL